MKINLLHKIKAHEYLLVFASIFTVVGCPVPEADPASKDPIGSKAQPQKSFPILNTIRETLDKANSSTRDPSPFGEKFVRLEGALQEPKGELVDWRPFSPPIALTNKYEFSLPVLSEWQEQFEAYGKSNGLPVVEGIVFRGVFVGPEQTQREGGILPRILLPSRNGFASRYDELIASGEDLEEIFNVGFHRNSHTWDILISCTTSVYVAQRFAFMAPTLAAGELQEGYVYAIYTRGLDITKVGVRDEHEVTAIGKIPFADVVAYRKVKRSGLGNPPIFDGPIHIRERFENLEPEAFKALIDKLTVRLETAEGF
jgi:hypothetical protein